HHEGERHRPRTADVPLVSLRSGRRHEHHERAGPRHPGPRTAPHRGRDGIAMPRPSILVVDDDAAHRRTVARVLGDKCDVVAATGAGQAIEQAGGQRFDIALVDIRMPGMDGFDLMSELKIADPDLDVILMTGSVTDTDLRLSRA